jgi:hypothetical protein
MMRMARLILALLLFSAIVLAAGSVVRLLTMAGPAPAPRREDFMPAAFRNTAYVLLLLLIFGVATGWLGAA